ncbi:MAG: hypothetical protein LBF16_07680 [Pseudomonadales bacterium]|jgi:hypothetical protein|nr:hypothetical protein [Pseudomonadales bacterium]
MLSTTIKNITRGFLVLLRLVSVLLILASPLHVKAQEEPTTLGDPSSSQQCGFENIGQFNIKNSTMVASVCVSHNTSLEDKPFRLSLTLRMSEDGQVICCIPVDPVEARREGDHSMFVWEISDLDKAAFNIVIFDNQAITVGSWKGNDSPLRDIQSLPNTSEKIRISSILDYTGQDRDVYIADPPNN